MPFGFFPAAAPFFGPFPAAPVFLPFFPFGFNPFLGLPVGLAAGAVDQLLLPGFATFPPGGVI